MKKGSKHTKEAIEKLKLSQLRILKEGKKTTKGYKHTENAKRIMSQKKKGYIPWNKGKKMKKEVWNKGKKGCQIAWNKGLKGYLKGNKHYNWMGGKSFEPYSVDWTETLKRSIRERDYYTCQLCNKQQGDIAHDVHHIDYDKKNCNPDNLITLCHSCHVKTNFNRGYWINFFKK